MILITLLLHKNKKKKIIRIINNISLNLLYYKYKFKLVNKYDP